MGLVFIHSSHFGVPSESRRFEDWLKRQNRNETDPILQRRPRSISAVHHEELGTAKLRRTESIFIELRRFCSSIMSVKRLEMATRKGHDMWLRNNIPDDLDYLTCALRLSYTLPIEKRLIGPLSHGISSRYSSWWYIPAIVVRKISGHRVSLSIWRGRHHLRIGQMLVETRLFVSLTNAPCCHIARTSRAEYFGYERTHQTTSRLYMLALASHNVPAILDWTYIRRDTCHYTTIRLSGRTIRNFTSQNIARNEPTKRQNDLRECHTSFDLSHRVHDDDSVS